AETIYQAIVRADAREPWPRDAAQHRERSVARALECSSAAARKIFGRRMRARRHLRVLPKIRIFGSTLRCRRREEEMAYYYGSLAVLGWAFTALAGAIALICWSIHEHKH